MKWANLRDEIGEFFKIVVLGSFSVALVIALLRCWCGQYTGAVSNGATFIASRDEVVFSVKAGMWSIPFFLGKWLYGKRQKWKRKKWGEEWERKRQEEISNLGKAARPWLERSKNASSPEPPRQTVREKRRRIVSGNSPDFIPSTIPVNAASWKTLRIFISSTFRDMQAERDHLVRFVFPKLREELMKRHIHLIDVDLRWGVTSDQDAVTICREVIDECHPRFMGMLGGRYGWVPESRERSITADEVHYGVLERDAELRGNAFFYFRDEASTASIVEETPGDFREPDGSGNARKLAELKQAIRDAGLPVFVYEAAWDQFQQRLMGLRSFGDHVFANLLQNIQNDPELAERFTSSTETRVEKAAERPKAMEAFLDDRPEIQVSEFIQERVAMDDFMEERTERYVLGSRQTLLDRLILFTVDKGKPNILVLEGEPGSGKSSLLAKLCQSLASRREILLITHFVGASSGSTDLRLILRRICQEIWQEFSSLFAEAKATRLAGVEEWYKQEIKKKPSEKEDKEKKMEKEMEEIKGEYIFPDDVPSLILSFSRWLKWIPPERCLIVVVDAVNQIDATDGAHSMHWLPQELPPNIRIIVSSPKHPTLDALRERGEDVRIEKLELLSSADAFDIIDTFLLHYSKRFSPEQVAALLAKPEARLPLYVHAALQELRTLGTYQEITDRIQELPGNAKELFGWILKQRLSSDPGFRNAEGQLCGFQLVTKFASYIGISRHGLSQEELIDLIDPGDPLGNVAALLRLLRPYLMHRGELIDFFHNQFREAVEEEYLKNADHRLEAHQLLATYFHEVADPHHEERWKGTSAHALSELPYHQAESEAWPALVAAFENIFFLEANTVHGIAFKLSQNLSYILARLPSNYPRYRILTLLAVALERDLPFISRYAIEYPQALFQCLWNSAWWYDCHEAAAYYEPPEGGWKQAPPWENPQTELKLSALLHRWRTEREESQPGFFWLRSLRPPPRPIEALDTVLRGHNEQISLVAFSPDGKRIVTGSRDKTVRLWNGTDGLELDVLRRHTYPVQCVAFSTDGEQIISYGSPGTQEDPFYTNVLDPRFFEGIPDDRRVLWNLTPEARKFSLFDYAADRYDLSVFWHALVEDETVAIRSYPDAEPEVWYPSAPKNLHSRLRGRVWTGNLDSHLVLLQLEGGNPEADAPFMEGYTGMLKCRKCDKLFNPSENETCFDTCHTLEPVRAFDADPNRPYESIYDYPCCNDRKPGYGGTKSRFPGCSLTSPYHTV